MYVGIGVLELSLPTAHDLKSKRRVVRSLVERLHARHRISAAETGAHDSWQHAVIGVAAVAASEREAQRLLDVVLETADAETESYVMNWSPQILEEQP
jgi:uncharacterized protein YlxP (DUF503 family)